MLKEAIVNRKIPSFLLERWRIKVPLGLDTRVLEHYWFIGFSAVAY